MTWSTRFVARRITARLDEAVEYLQYDVQDVFQDLADEGADEWNRAIMTNSGPQKSDTRRQMATVRGQVTSPKRGGFFIRLGWLDSPPAAEDGKTSWYVYQDVGYNMFGRGMHIQGLLAQMDARARLEVKIQRATKMIVKDVERIVSG